jgi:hypothetical protein
VIRPDEERARDKAAREREASQLLRRAMDACGLSCDSLAFWLLTTKSRVERAQSTTYPDTLPLRDVLGLPPIALRVVVDALATQLGLTVVELPTLSEMREFLSLATSAHRESAEAVAETLDAVADGHVTRAEGARIEERCDRAIAFFMRIREEARRAQREGVIGLRAVGGTR